MNQKKICHFKTIGGKISACFGLCLISSIALGSGVFGGGADVLKMDESQLSTVITIIDNNTHGAIVSMSHGLTKQFTGSIGVPYIDKADSIILKGKYNLWHNANNTELVTILSGAQWHVRDKNKCSQLINDDCVDAFLGIAYERQFINWQQFANITYTFENEQSFSSKINLGVGHQVDYNVFGTIELNTEYANEVDTTRKLFLTPGITWIGDVILKFGYQIPLQDGSNLVHFSTKYTF